MNLMSSGELYHFYRELKELLKFKQSKINKFLKMRFGEILTERFYKTARFDDGAKVFIDITNEINSGTITFKEWVYIIIGEYIKTNKLLTVKNLTNFKNLKKYTIFYSVFETKRQIQMLNILSEQIEHSNSFENFSDEKKDVFSVNVKQKNLLYKMVKNGEVNFYCYLYFMNKKFYIDEKKIDDIEFLNFIKLMQIIKINKEVNNDKSN